MSEQDTDGLLDRIEELEAQLAGPPAKSVSDTIDYWKSRAEAAEEEEDTWKQRALHQNEVANTQIIRAEAAEAQLAKVTAERDAALRYGDKAQKWLNDAEKDRSSWKRHAETYRAAIPVAYQMALEAALPLPRPDGESTWTLDPKFVMDVAHTIQREEGWDTSMEVVELAMLAAERRMLEAKTSGTLTPPADLVEQATAKVKETDE